MLRRSLVLALALLAMLAPVARADRLTRGEEQIPQQLGQLCRYPTNASNDCDALDGYHLNEADVEGYESSWVHRAIGLQRALDDDVPLIDELFPHTHNSFNSEAYTPTVSRMDHNQLLSITGQLRLDIRAIEIDVHRAVSVSDGRIGVVACHANDNAVGSAHVHVGCTSEDPLKPYLVELRAWLNANPHQLVLLYLENHLEGDPVAHDEAAANIHDTIGDLVYTSPGGCTPMPYGTSRATILGGGKQVLIVGDCGPGAWGTYVFDRGPKWDESSDPAGENYVCAADRAAHDYDREITRRYEDRTWLTAMVGTEGGITTKEMAAMVGCGVNLVGFDMLHPADPRLETLVWSWAQGEPAATGGDCAAQRADGRFVAAPCEARKRAACHSDAGWTVTAKPLPWVTAARACAAIGAAFNVPWNGWENHLLLTAGGGDVWLAYANGASGWQPQRAA